MGRTAAARRYSGAQILVHWATAVLIVGLLAAGLTMTSLGPGPLKNALYETHKSFGIVVFALAVLRLGLRGLHGAPEPEPAPRWMRLAARISHVALYVLILAVPLTGWLGTSACCAPVNLFWAIDTTAPLGRDFDLARRIFAAHETLAYLLAFVVLVHAGAALHHHYGRRDGTLRRMAPAREKPRLVS